MKKNNNLTKVLVIMLILTMLALIAIAGTYAKYTTEITGTGTAVVGSWNINVTKDSDPLENNFKINLADTITSADNANDFIQPGSAGSFVIKVENKGDVPAVVKAVLTNQSTSLFKQGQFTISAAGDATGSDGVVIEPDTSKDVTITWAWDYEMAENTTTSDADDTTIGKAATGTEETICNIKLTATQVDPNA